VKALEGAFNSWTNEHREVSDCRVSGDPVDWLMGSLSPMRKATVVMTFLILRNRSSSKLSPHRLW
jgi:hypothetical protein